MYVIDVIIRITTGEFNYVPEETRGMLQVTINKKLNSILTIK